VKRHKQAAIVISAAYGVSDGYMATDIPAKSRLYSLEPEPALDVAARQRQLSFHDHVEMGRWLVEQLFFSTLMRIGWYWRQPEYPFDVTMQYDIVDLLPIQATYSKLLKYCVLRRTQPSTLSETENE